jgi:hypothetical protein
MLLEVNRNHYLIVGVILFLLGLQFRYVQSFTLTEDSARFIQKGLGNTGTSTPDPVTAFIGTAGATEPRRTMQPPRWLGFSLISIGVVLTLQSLALKKPG